MFSVDVEIGQTVTIHHDAREYLVVAKAPRAGHWWLQDSLDGSLLGHAVPARDLVLRGNEYAPDTVAAIKSPTTPVVRVLHRSGEWIVHRHPTDRNYYRVGHEPSGAFLPVDLLSTMALARELVEDVRAAAPAEVGAELPLPVEWLQDVREAAVEFIKRHALYPVP